MTQVDRVEDEALDTTPAAPESGSSFRAAIAERFSAAASEPAEPDTAAAESADAEPSAEASGGDTPEPAAPRTPDTTAVRPVEALRLPELREHARGLSTRITELETELAEHRTFRETTEQTQREALASLGDPARYEKVANQVQVFEERDMDLDYYMDADDLAFYRATQDRMKHAGTLLGMARRSLYVQNLEAMKDLAAELKLDANYIARNPDTVAIVRHAVAVTEARVRAEHKDELEEAKADAESARSVAHGRAKAVNARGRYSGDAETPRPKESDFRAAIRQKVERESGKRGLSRL